MKYFLLIWGSLTIVFFFFFVYFLITLYFLFAVFIVVQYKYSRLLVYVYCRKYASCTTWFLNNLFSCGGPSPAHQITIIWPRILGPACQRKRHSHTTLNKKFEPIKNKIQSLQNFSLLNIEQKNCEKCYVHNTFIINMK